MKREMERTVKRLRAMVENWNTLETLPDDAIDLRNSLLIQIELLEAQIKCQRTN